MNICLSRVILRMMIRVSHSMHFWYPHQQIRPYHIKSIPYALPSNDACLEQVDVLL